MAQAGGLCSGRTVASLLALTIVSLAVLTMVAMANTDAATPSGRNAAGPADEFVPLPGNILSVLGKATEIKGSPHESSAQITITLVLRRNYQAGFERYLHDVYDPHSPNFHRYLTQSEIANRFGPSPVRYQSMLGYMRAHGFTLVQGSKNRLTLVMRGTRGAAERAFDVKIRDYRIGKRTFYANDRNPGLPASLAGQVQAIVGISNLAQPHNTVQATTNAFLALAKQFRQAPSASPSSSGSPSPTPSSSPSSSPSPSPAPTPGPTSQNPPIFIDTVIQIPPQAGNDECSFPDNVCLLTLPSGGTIGLLEFDNFVKSDVENYLALENLPASEINSLSEVDVNGGVAPGPEQSEVLLDIDVVLTLAPGSPVVVFDGPFQGAGVSFQAMFNAMLNHGGITIISNSWAYCEDETTQADVDSIDSILQQAATAGITVFNGSGDTGSTCLDGSANTVAVPADSPNATAVGATSLVTGPGNTYVSETWWNGQNSTPPSGQGGFGISKFFPEPSYQQGLLPMLGGRSVPDVVEAADPQANGIYICWDAGGGCPNGLLYGGTSAAAPVWAAYTATMAFQLGQNIGFLNPLAYPLASSPAFHDAASMGTTPLQVGLGSPNLGDLELGLSVGLGLAIRGTAGITPDPQSVGPVSAAASTVQAWGQLSLFVSPFEMTAPAFYFPADGATDAFVVVRLVDANHHIIRGKTVTLSANSGSNAQISPSSDVSSANNGAVVFTVTDSTPENLTFTATDTTDGVTLAQQPTFKFGVPPAVSAGIGGGPASVAADGSSNANITVTLQDSLGRGTAGKVVALSQSGGNSVISGPSPSVTNGSGQVTFSTTDVKSENITYTATDVTDGNLAVPGSVNVDFTNGSGCAGGSPDPAAGYGLTSFATGFTARTFNFGNVNFGCIGAFGLAFDPSGNLYVAHAPTGNVYKFPPAGGMAGNGTLITSTPLGPATLGLAFDKSGNLFAARAATTGDFTTGDVVQVDPSTGAIIREVSSGLVCPFTLATDPISGDLFTGDGCTGAGSDRTIIWRISDPGGASPTTSVYANTPGQDNFGITFAPDGTMYVITRNFEVARITATNAPQPPTVSIVPNVTWGNLGIATGGMQSNGDAQFLLVNSPSGPPRALQTFDLTTNPPSPGVLISDALGALDTKVIGPDGCLYSAAGLAVYRFTDASGNCVAAPTPLPATISLTPDVASPNPALGGSQSFTATLHHTSIAAGIPMTFEIAGANPQAAQVVSTDASGQATFSYTGIHQGLDNVVALATVNDAKVTSNLSQVTWGAGQDVTFLTLNLSPKSGTPGQPVNLIASLSDISQNPPAPVVGQTVTLALGNNMCSASTDAQGNAACQVSPRIIPGVATRPLTASFAGTGSLVASTASTGFTFTAPAENASLVVGPKTRGFPAEIELGGVGATSKPAAISVFNPKNKKQNLVVTFLGAENTGDFAIVPGAPTTCNATLAPKSRCTIGVTFSPTGVGTRTGTLVISDNAKLNNPQMVNLKGVGKQGKLTFAPRSLNFGKATAGTTSSAKTVKLANKNPVPMSLSAAASGPFTITSNSCPASLPANGTCSVAVAFRPAGAGAAGGALTFTDTAVGSPQSVKLIGTGN